MTNCRIPLRARTLQGRWITVDGNRIQAIGSMSKGAPEEGEILDVGGATVAPGFIDIHTHGFGGHPFYTGREESVRGASVALAQRGVTSCLASIPSLPNEATHEALDAIRRVMADPEPNGARVLGAHLEGPYINVEAAGAQDTKSVRPIDLNECRSWVSTSTGLIRMATIAPELDNSSELITLLAKHGVITSIGHTCATYEEAMSAIHAGAWCATHVFNCMKAFHHREPGALAAVMGTDLAHCEYIADGAHSHPGALRMLVAAKGYDRVMLVSDSVPMAGTDKKTMTVDGRTLTVRSGTARAKDGTLAGGLKALDEGLQFAASVLPVDAHKLTRMTSANQARVLGIADEVGDVKVGMIADLVVLDSQLKLQRVLVGGKPLPPIETHAA